MDVSLTVETGREAGTRNSRRLRAEGLIPGVVYGLGSDPTPVVVPWTELRRALTTEAGTNALIDLEVDGATHLSIVKDLQRHPVRRDVLHVDFLRIDPNLPLAVEVPITLVGRAEKVEAVKGMIDQLMYTLQVKAKPGEFPTQLEADVSHLEIGVLLKVSDVVLPDGVTTDVGPEESVAIASPTRSTILLQQEQIRAEKVAAGEPDDPAEAGSGDSSAEG
jgi:large subunit ribosomal protein L25